MNPHHQDQQKELPYSFGRDERTGNWWVMKTHMKLGDVGKFPMWFDDEKEARHACHTLNRGGRYEQRRR